MKSALVILLDREGQVQARERVSAGTVELLEKQIACAVRRMSHDRLCVGDTISVLDGEEDGREWALVESRMRPAG